jgi:hypothetical protein
MPNLFRLGVFAVDIPGLAPDEPLSPELVLVLPAELRARVLAVLGDPVWPTPQYRPAEAPAQPPIATASASAAVAVAETRVRRATRVNPPAYPAAPFARSFAALVGARLVQLVLIFVAVTIFTLAMTIVAQAVR